MNVLEQVQQRATKVMEGQVRLTYRRAETVHPREGKAWGDLEK